MNSKTHLWLKPIQLKGGQSLPHRLMPGPMMGLMSPLFFHAVNELNLTDYWITPFIGLSIATPRLITLKKKLEHYLNSEKTFIVQLLGNNPKVIAETASQLSKLKIAGINLNFACPSATVLSTGSGASLLTKPELMLEIIHRIREACPDISISLKLRTGVLSPNDIEIFIPKLSRLDVDFIILHFRTATERYKTIEGGHDRIKQAVNLASETSMPIIASGDIFSFDNAMEMYNQSACHGITVARGLFEDPFLIRRIEANLLGSKLSLSTDPKVIFSEKLRTVAIKFPNLYGRSNFLGLIRSIWGGTHFHFNNIKTLPKNKILEYHFKAL